MSAAKTPHMLYIVTESITRVSRRFEENNALFKPDIVRFCNVKIDLVNEIYHSNWFYPGEEIDFP